MKTISKFLGLSIMIMLIGMPTYGQKCKYEYQKIDELSGKTSKAIIFEVSDDLILRYKKVNDNYEIDVIIHFTWANGGEAYSRSQTMNMEIGDSLTFKLSTGEIVSIYATKQLVPTQEQHGFGSFGGSSLSYDAVSIDKSDLEKLANGTISYVRVNLGKQIYDGSLKPKQSNTLQSVLRCIL